MSQTPFYKPLLKSVTILVVDDDPYLLDYYEDMLSGHPLYTVIKAATAREAESAIRSPSPIHLCILDFGIDDIDNDEYYLLRKYARKMPFVVISGSADMERAFEAARIGAAGMIAKPPDMNAQQFWTKLSDLFLQKTILPDLSSTSNTQLNECCRILIEGTPESVSEWAMEANITDAYLRKLWNDCYTFPPKHVLFMYRVYKSAFAYYNALYNSEINETDPFLPNIDSAEQNRQMQYYMQNKSMLDGIRDRVQ